ncbi:MAG: hypothetical protein AUG50_03480 [Betaproteobacteria bacterium 13_1_20CM_3_63_8]|nr:MAG: hypothetical protein AUG50_03480 [Betaproteobacteria bacterium 13_1_20CM_3_63_8]
MTPRNRASAVLVAAALSWAPTPGAQPQSSAPQPAAPPGILDPQFPVKPLDDALNEARGNRLASPALERYDAGDYREAARLGLAILGEVPQQHALRYAVANSLAWTGRYDPAIEQYRALLSTEYDARARIGMANVMLWSGQPDLAERHYLAVLEREPGNEEARRGATFSGRELRTALTLRLTQTQDNQQLKRDELLLTFRQWSADRALRWEVGALRDRNDSPQLSSSNRAVMGSVWAVQAPLSPRLEASVYGDDFFGTAQLEPVRDRLRVRFGRVNWGRLAFNAQALADRLTARTLGVSGEAYPGIGIVRGRVDGYDISDGNRVVEGELQITPASQRLPMRLEWFGGVFGRGAEREDPRYWSPRPAYGLAFIGLRRGWYTDRMDANAWLRAGAGFTATAKTSWSAGLTGRYWIGRDVAVGLEAWSVDAPRPADYRMHQVAAFVQHLW